MGVQRCERASALPPCFVEQTCPPVENVRVEAHCRPVGIKLVPCFFPLAVSWQDEGPRGIGLKNSNMNTSSVGPKIPSEKRVKAAPLIGPLVGRESGAHRTKITFRPTIPGTHPSGRHPHNTLVATFWMPPFYLPCRQLILSRLYDSIYLVLIYVAKTRPNKKTRGCQSQHIGAYTFIQMASRTVDNVVATLKMYGFARPFQY